MAAGARAGRGGVRRIGGFRVPGRPQKRHERADRHQQQRGRRRFRRRRAAQGAPGPEDDCDLCRENKEFERQFLSGELDVELVPQGTFAERIRAGGAGIGGFFTPTGYGTLVAEGKETRIIDGKPYVLEPPLQADFAFVKAWKGDRAGNLVYRRTARNFNPVMATARVTIAEVEHLVEPGELDPDHVVTPGIFVRYILQGDEKVERETR